MRKKTSIIDLALAVFICLMASPSLAQEQSQPDPNVFIGTVNADRINLRIDASANSQVISALPKGRGLEVVLEKYGWYKVRLPRSIAVFVSRRLLEPIDERTAKAKGDNINIRMQPNQSSPILGKLQNNEVVSVLEDRGEWIKIEPTANTFGWIYAKFIDRGGAVIKQEQQQAEAEAKPVKKPVVGQDITVTGILQPYGKVINRIATHKLITKDYSVYLLKGNTDNLKSLVYHNVKIEGKIITPLKEKYPVIDINKLEALD